MTDTPQFSDLDNILNDIDLDESSPQATGEVSTDAVAIDPAIAQNNSEDTSSAPAPSKLKPAGVSSEDTQSLLKLFIHGRRDELEQMVSDAEAHNAEMRKVIEDAAKANQKAKDAEKAPKDDEDEDVDPDAITSTSDFDIPDRNMAIINSSIDVMSGGFKALSSTKLIEAPSFVRAIRSALRVTPSYRILEDIDMKEGVTPMARIGILPLQGSVSLMLDSDIPHDADISIANPASGFPDLEDRNMAVSEFMNQSGAARLTDINVQDGMFRKTHFDDIRILITDTHTYLLFNSQYLPGDSADHRNAKARGHGPDADYIYYPYQNKDNFGVIDLDGTTTSKMLLAFAGGRDLMIQAMRSRSGMILSDQEIEEKVDQQIALIRQDNAMELFGQRRGHEGDVSREHADIESQERFINSVNSNTAHPVVNEVAISRDNRNMMNVSAIMRQMITEDSAIDITGSRMTLTSHDTLRTKEKERITTTVTLNESRPDLASSMTDCVVAFKGVCRLQTTGTDPLPLSWEFVENAKSCAYEVGRNLSHLTYAIRNLEAIKEAVDLYGMHAVIKRSNQTYSISRSDEDRSGNLREAVRNASTSIDACLEILKRTLKTNPDDTTSDRIARFPYTILLESQIAREAMGYIVNKPADICAVISNSDDGENYVQTSDILTSLDNIINRHVRHPAIADIMSILPNEAGETPLPEPPSAPSP